MSCFVPHMHNIVWSVYENSALTYIICRLCDWNMRGEQTARQTFKTNFQPRVKQTVVFSEFCVLRSNTLLHFYMAAFARIRTKCTLQHDVARLLDFSEKQLLHLPNIYSLQCGNSVKRRRTLTLFVCVDFWMSRGVFERRKQQKNINVYSIRNSAQSPCVHERRKWQNK